MSGTTADTAPNPIELHAGDLRLALRPDLGGCIAGFWHRDMPILRSTEPALLSASRPSASYPLVPYSNRLGHRRFRWKGRDHTTVQNFDDNPHSVHGVGWQRLWQVIEARANEVTMRYRHAADAHWPFPFDVTQGFVLTPTRLAVSLTLTNTAEGAQPVGLGWHPYFVKRMRSALQIAVTSRWEPDATGLSRQAVQQPDIDGAVSGLDFDHCFDGWQGPAQIDDEAFSLRLTSSLSRLVLYTPRDKAYFCVEPVSHVSNAIQMADPESHGLQTLRPGETTQASMTLEVGAR
jgi:aldose 1-epimerase